jgi:hypothetical protein
MFLRSRCVLPGGLGLMQESFCGEWMPVEDTMSTALDLKVRNAGWHFLSLEDACSHFGVGRTSASAVGKATRLALNQIKSRFNAAELGSVSVSKYPDFQVAKVTLQTRHIQQHASFSLLTK